MSRLRFAVLLSALPNTFTLLNLACGYFAIGHVFLSERPLINIASVHHVLWLAAFFDFLDGFLARRLGKISAMGKQLDSLADMVSFGIVPALYYAHLFTQSGLEDWSFLSAVVVLGTAYRLGRFNTSSPTPFFKGLPTPMHALFVTALPLSNTIIKMPQLLFLPLFLGSLLMISRYPFLSLKGISLHNKRFYAVFLLFLSIFLLSFLWAGVFVYATVLYVLASLFFGWLKRDGKRQAAS